METKTAFSDFLSISLDFFFRFSWNVDKNSTSTVLYSLLKSLFCRVVTAFLPEKKSTAKKYDKSTSYSKAIYFSRMVPDNYCCIESFKFPSVRRSISKLFGLSNRFLPLCLSERFHRINKSSENVVQNSIKKCLKLAKQFNGSNAPDPKR
jgi:hypothetical protein